MKEDQGDTSLIQNMTINQVLIAASLIQLL
jgi:hypothetical protein